MALPEQPRPGDVFEHYKGGSYVWLMEATLEADETAMVAYRQQASGRVFVRPASEFYGMATTKEVLVPRFAKVIQSANS